MTFNNDSTLSVLFFEMENNAIYTRAIERKGVYKESETNLHVNIFIKEKNVVSENNYTLKWYGDDEIGIIGFDSKETRLVKFGTSGDFFTKKFTPIYVEAQIQRGKEVRPAILEAVATPYRNVRGKCYKLKEGDSPYLAFQFSFDGPECKVLVKNKRKEGTRVESRSYLGGRDDLTIIETPTQNRYSYSEDAYKITWINSQEFIISRKECSYSYILSDTACMYF